METDQLNEIEKDLGVYQDPNIEGPQNGPSDYLNDLFKNRKQNSTWASEQVGFMGGSSSKRKGRRLIVFSWAAALLDSVLILATSVLFVATLSIALRQFNHEFFEVLKQIPSQQFVAVIFVMTAWVYQVSLRSFIGCTLGEWCYDLKMGSPFDRLLLSYSLKVVLRTTISIATGFFLFPILSMIFGQDLLGRICGLKVYSLK